MIDVELTQDEYGRFDIDIENGDLAHEDGFETAIWVSLFTDARAPSSKVTLPEARRGWVGNTVSTVIGRDLGSLLWIAEQRRMNQDTVNEIVGYVQSALNWFVDDGLAARVEVSGEIVATYGIRLFIEITSPNGSTTNQYVNLWELTGDQ